ncbi:hypothetical protein SAMN00808754_1652 [Thermanaeromonas toyohensis ToBE]|uniref:Uncharacterized protein n=1 Tax=Thermanaeromonas toyohensis ToBE TaxID=698762 RepID=A0A1W1VU79_9FIRM|nr:hypothetical protein [Thermanaeromonas toyohensis]SMB96790.1 hypothetical protein SAMN00808754_1652 [Thermanaeromonas toyohensis ToBE]
MHLKDLKVKNLSAAAIYAQPAYYNWDEHDGEWYVVYPVYGEGLEDENVYEPMMNYYYPLPRVAGDPKRLANILHQKHLPLALVCFPETKSYALALTAGGMDLTWEICFGYILAGYLPPFYFCDLPQYPGMRANGWRRLVLSACRRTCQIIKRQAASRLYYLKAERFFGNTRKNTEREVMAPGA